jgi:hypothetical protein
LSAFRLSPESGRPAQNIDMLVAKHCDTSWEGSGLDDHSVLRHLEELAQHLAIQIRYENIRKEASFYPGGLCQLKGAYLLIINKKSTVRERIKTLANAVKRFDLTEVYLKPGLRDFLENMPDAGDGH